MVAFTHTHITAQADDQQAEISKEALITQCLQIATSYARRYKHRLNHSEIGDLVGEAMLAIIEKVEEARNKENPLAWLLSVGKYAMIEYISTRDTLISHSHRCKHYTMMSLDVPRYGETTGTTLLDTLTCSAFTSQSQEDQDYALLYEAIGRLSPKRQQLISQRFGLQGYPETELKEMAPTRREQQRIAKALVRAKQTLASYLEARKESVA